MKRLAEEGHSVTIVSPFAPKKPIQNYKEIVLERAWEEYQGEWFELVLLHFTCQHKNNFSFLREQNWRRTISSISIICTFGK